MSVCLFSGVSKSEKEDDMLKGKLCTVKAKRGVVTVTEIVEECGAKACLSISGRNRENSPTVSCHECNHKCAPEYVQTRTYGTNIYGKCILSNQYFVVSMQFIAKA
jgi:hypothetical protein